MAQAKKHILPFFIPHLGCPQQCVFCDQHKITGQQPPAAEQIAAAIVALPPELAADFELAFYGGSFTALPLDLQTYYLEPARRALAEGRLGSVRVSTRPDCINPQILTVLRQYGVNTVELGVQSMLDEVLQKARRGHTAAQALAALRLLQQAGFTAGVQLMPGLPGESPAACLAGAGLLLRERPAMLRIYPTVVLQGSGLAALYQRGQYQPLTLDEAAAVTLALKIMADDLGIKVIRMGLQPSETLNSQVLAGPYHQAFGSLVQGLYWRNKILWALQKWPGAQVVALARQDISAAVGHKRQNTAFYQQLVPGLRITAADLPVGSSLLIWADGRRQMFTDVDFRRGCDVIGCVMAGIV